MAGELDALKAQVAATTTVEQSAIVLIQGLHDRLVAAGTDPVQLGQLATDLKTGTDALAASITANTGP